MGLSLFSSLFCAFVILDKSVIVESALLMLVMKAMCLL